MQSVPPPPKVSVLGRYALFEAIAAGGMARVYLGRQLGAAGFARTVAIKRMLPHLVEDQRLVTMFIDEARLAARIRHPNVVPILDVVSDGSELFLVMEYVAGEALGMIQRTLHQREERVPPEIASSIVTGVLYGLHAAHEAVTEEGKPLDLVHRDVSPQNILVGADGVARVLDFGVAKAVGRLQQTTQRGQLKGKLGYVAPEQLSSGGAVTRAADIYASGVVLWELLAGRKLFTADNQGAIMLRILDGEIPPLSEVAPDAPPAAAEVVERAIARAPGDRFASALEMATALERAIPPASPGRVAAWVQGVAQEVLTARAEAVTRVERAPLPAELEEAALSMRSPPSFAAIRPPEQGAGTGAGQASEVEPPPAERGKRRWAALVLASALAAMAVALVISIGRVALQDEGSAEAAGTPGNAASMTTPPPQPPIAPIASAPDPAASASSAGDPRPAPSGKSTGAPDKGTLDPKAAAAPSPAASRPKNPCDPPYYIDKDGIQRVKRHCYPR